MRKGVRALLIAVPLTAVVVGGVVVLRNRGESGIPGYTTAPVERRDIITTITSTGTLEPVAVVEVGTQVSGVIEKVYVDFNDTVSRGQLIAELDRTFLAGALDEALASHKRAQALFELAEAEYRRGLPLYEKGFLSEQEFARLRADVRTQEAQLLLAAASVKKARINLGYATITSPITGTVIQRTIEAGQTVAASLSAPTLFIIAEDLRRMQILASVDEADIGGIRQGQEVRFSVQAFPDREFTGAVEQVRLQPVSTQNVVTYTVVIATENPHGVLLPGMTATVDFITGKALATLAVPNAALRFRPPSQDADVSRAAPRKQTGVRQRAHEGGSGRPRREGTGKGRVYTLSPEGIPVPHQLRSGITDGRMTALHDDAGLTEGTAVITGITPATTQSKRAVSLLPQQPAGRRR